jgi:hypothetical protein
MDVLSGLNNRMARINRLLSESLKECMRKLHVTSIHRQEKMFIDPLRDRPNHLIKSLF